MIAGENTYVKIYVKANDSKRERVDMYDLIRLGLYKQNGDAGEKRLI